MGVTPNSSPPWAVTFIGVSAPAHNWNHMVREETPAPESLAEAELLQPVRKIDQVSKQFGNGQWSVDQLAACYLASHNKKGP